MAPVSAPAPVTYTVTVGAWHPIRDCGHQHRTLETAERCRYHLTRRYPDGLYNAVWYNATICTVGETL